MPPRTKPSSATPTYFIPDADVINALPEAGFVREYVKWALTETDAPASYHLAGALASLAVSVDARYCLRWPGGTLYPNLYVMLVGPSVIGRKSTALGMAMKMVQAQHPERVGASPGSHEGLLRGLSLQPQQIIAEPEFSRFLSQSNGRSFLNAVKQTYTDAYDCTPLTRITALVDVEINDPRLSLFAAIAPGYLERYLEAQDLSSGFFARWLYFCGTRDRFLMNMRGGLPAYLTAQLSETARLTPGAVCSMSPDAEVYFTELARKVDTYARHLDEADDSRGVIARAPGMLAKVALLIAAAEHADTAGESASDPDVLDPEPLAIEKEHILCAEKIINLHLRSALQIQDNLAQSQYMMLRRDVLSVIRHFGPCAIGTITKRTHQPKRSIDPVLETLLLEGEVLSYAGSSLKYGIADKAGKRKKKTAERRAVDALAPATKKRKRSRSAGNATPERSAISAPRVVPEPKLAPPRKTAQSRTSPMGKPKLHAVAGGRRRYVAQYPGDPEAEHG